MRRLIALTVTATAPPELLAERPQRATALADQLEVHLPEPGGEPTTRFADESVAVPTRSTRLASAMPFDVIIGSCNPLALPIDIEFDPPQGHRTALFTAPYEGAPGCVHGAVLAGAFDIMLTAANVIANGAGPTVNLSIRYLKPTRVAEPRPFESWVTSLDGRRTHSRGPSDPGRGGHRRGRRGVRQHGAGPDHLDAPSGHAVPTSEPASPMPVASRPTATEQVPRVIPT